MITFYNPGEIDIRLVTTLGVNVKESYNPIGYFGTGLKYALAVLLRERQEIEVWSGSKCYEFSTVREQIRGKEFEFVEMTCEGEVQRLGFTTELGKNWTLENAYRELYSNAVDEGGSVSASADAPAPANGRTVIRISGDRFHDVWLRRDEIVLNPERKPLWEGPHGAIYYGKTNVVYYHGLAAYKSTRPMMHTYDLQMQLKLTEDRTLGGFDVDYEIQRLLGECKDKEILRNAYCGKEQMEAQSSYVILAECEEFCEVIGELIKSHPLELTPQVLHTYRTARPEQIEHKEISLTQEQFRELSAAINFWLALGFPVDDYRIAVAEDLGKNVLARAEHGASPTIWLSLECFKQRVLREALLEEYFHLRDGVGDYTLEMQNLLFKTIVELGEKVGGGQADAN